MRSNHGVRNLALLRESGSTARVLNLAFVYERFGETEEYQEKPLFRNQLLNRSLILKHVLRPEERGLFSCPPVQTTKLVLPFSASELRLGGRSLFFGERNFMRGLQSTVSADDEASFEADLDLLRLLNSLPSFDPFLLRERLRRAGHDVALCYFDISEADIARIGGFVAREIEALVHLAYPDGGVTSRDLAARLAEKLMTDETARALDPLRLTLRLSEAEYREGVFVWKAFLYYKWVSQELTPLLADLSREMLSTKASGAQGDDRRTIDELRQRMLNHLSVGARRVQEAVDEYADAFHALAHGRPRVFRDFLIHAPSMFIPIGEAVGVIKHVHSFWRFRFPARRVHSIPVDEALEIFTELEATLGSMQVLHQGPAALLLD